MKSGRLILVLLGIALILPLMANLGLAAKPKVVRIGFLGALTGNVATYGIMTLKGMEMAASEINTAGGVLGHKVVILKEDDRGDKTEIVNITKKYVTQDKVAAVVGDPTTGGTKAAAPICQANKVVLLSAGAVGPNVEAIGDYIFRNTLLDGFAAPATINYLMKVNKWKKFAMVTSSNNDFSVGLSAIFKDAVKKAGGKVLSEEFIADGDTVFSAQVTKIKRLKADAIIFTGYYTEGGLFMKEVRKQGLSLVMVGGDGLLSPDLIKLGEKAVEGSYVYCGFSPQQAEGNTAKFLENFKKKNQKEADLFVAQGYDAVKLLAKVMTDAKSIDPKKFRSALAKTKNYQGVSGTLSFLPDRRPLKSPVFVNQVKGGKFSLFAKVPVKP